MVTDMDIEPTQHPQSNYVLLSSINTRIIQCISMYYYV